MNLSKKSFIYLFILLVIIILSIALIVIPQTPKISKQQRITQLEQQVRCPVCGNLPIADSTAPIAMDLKQAIVTQVNQGRTNQEILNWLRQRYGNAIVLSSNPPISVLDIVAIIVIVSVIISIIVLIRAPLSKSRHQFFKPLNIKRKHNKLRLIVGLLGIILTLSSIGFLIVSQVEPSLLETTSSTKASSITNDLSLAQGLAANGQVALAIYVYNQVLNQDPLNAKALAQQGYLISESGFNDKNSKLIKQGYIEIKKAISIEPEYADAYLYLGTIEFTSFQNTSLAVQHFKMFLKLNKNPILLKQSKKLIASAYSKLGIPPPKTLS